MSLLFFVFVDMRSLALVFFGVLFFLSGTVTVSAQSTAGIELKPSTIERAANPGEVIDEVFSLTNFSDVTQTYYLVTRDISGVGDDDGVPIFADAGAEVTGYELSTWVSYAADPIELKPKESREVPIKITVPGNASPGSHFGGVFVTVEPPKLRQIGAGVAYEVGALVSIRIAGDVLESGRIREFSTTKLLYGSADVGFLARVENPGNVLIRPHGLLEINNMFGKRVGFIKVNESLAGVFPGTTRSFNVTWQDEGLAFGRYQAIIGLLYGEEGGQSTVSATVSFWVLPVKILVPVLGALSLIILVTYLSVKIYIRRALDGLTTSQGRRVVARNRKSSSISRLMVIAVTLLVTTTLFLIGLLVLFA